MREVPKVYPILPDGWSRAKGFSYGMHAPDCSLLFVAGQLAVVDGAAAVEKGLGFAVQFERCLRNVLDVVRTAGGEARSITLLRAFVRDMNAFKAAQTEIAVAWRALLDRHFPAMTVVEVSALFDANALVEIEAVAIIAKADTQ